MGRGKKKSIEQIDEGLPRLTFYAREDIPQLSASPWLTYIDRDKVKNVIKCGLRVGTPPTIYQLKEEMTWVVFITRERRETAGDSKQSRRVLANWFEATVGLHWRGCTEPVSIGETAVLMRGYCADWEDAIATTSMGNIGKHLREWGETIYGEGARSDWQMIRPFDVKYPYRTFEEPNAQYSPYEFKGRTFDPDSDGAVASIWKAGSKDAATFIHDTPGFKSNAFLWGPIKVRSGQEGLEYRDEYRLYHRDAMSSYDVVDIDDWRARIISGTRD